MITKFLRNTSICLIFLTTLIPLYVDNSLFFPFITGKAFAFRIIIEIVFAIWLLLVIRDRKYAPKFSWLSVLVTAFVGVILVADLAGVNPLRSIWSNFERMEGWIALVHLWAFFIASTSIFGGGEEGRRMWHNFFKMSLFSAMLVGIYGVVQLLGGAEIHQGSSRIDASLGNAAYMAVYMLGHAFLAFYLALVEWSRQKKGFMWIYIILGVFFSFLLYETATRGTILGLVGGLTLALAIFSVFGKGESKKLRLAGGGVILLFVLLGAGLIAAKDTEFVKNSTTLNRLASISWNENKTQARGYIWPMAVKGVFESPKTAVIGWGQENFNYIFNKNYNPKMWSQEQWFDRAHSVFLDWLVAGGLAGFLLYVSLFVASLVLLWKSRLTFAEKCLMTGLFVGYAIHNVFVFDNIASYMIFFTLLGFVHSTTAEKSIRWLEVSDQQTENQLVVRDYIYFPLILILFLGTLYFVNVRPLQANKKLILAMSACINGSPSLDLYKNSLKYNVTVANQETREQLLSCSASVISSPNAPAQLKKDFYDFSIAEIQKQLQSSPNDARIYTLAGSYFNNIQDWETGRPLLEKAAELSPNKQTILFEVGNNYLNSGRTQEAEALFEKAYLSAPENNSAQRAYASVLILNGKEAKARELFASTPEALENEQVANIYARLKNYPRVIEIYRKLIEKNPGNLQHHAAIASAYFESGQRSLAIAELEKMKVNFPYAASQIDAAIEQVKSTP